MAKKPDEEKDISFPNQKIVNINLEHEMENAYIEYAMSVIVGRALPDVRDGLKPVHRRILYSMYESGLTSDKPFKKSATCVGDVLGKYHPHGDASVYDAMVRLGQDFSMRYCLVEGHGNFGSIDGDPPAAYRYTEARMSKIANEMLRDIEKETVDWDPNFDESRKEPRVLPSRFPNLLVNGSSGIAVGMTTNIPPHNLREVIDATICVLDNREATLDDLMEHIKGPDFPTRGIIMGRSGIRAAYATGKGHIRVRARTEMEEFGNGRTRIIVTELPYQVNKSRLVENIADQVKEKRLEGISGLRDESDGKKGMRIVIELKKDANPQVVLNRLFAQTQMQTTFAVVMLALVNNQRQPKILTLRGILDEYIAFQEQIITRRTIYDRRKAQERAHLLQGLLIAQDNIDEVIHIIRTSYDDAKDKLMERFGLDDVQAQAILDMQLKRLQGLEKEKLEAEFAELEKKIAYYDQLLSDEEMLAAQVLDYYIGQTGVAESDAALLRKQLAGKTVRCWPGTGAYENGFSGTSSPKDVETLLQLVYLYLAQPRFDGETFGVVMEQLRHSYRNRTADPSFRYGQEVNETMYGGSPRRPYFVYDDIDGITLEQLQTIYGKLYGNPGDFTFFITGNVDENTLRPLVEKYIGSLPRASHRAEWVDDGVRTPVGTVENRFAVKMEQPKVSACTLFTGRMPYTLENTLAMAVLGQLLDIRYTAVMREDKGGTYGVSVSGLVQAFPVQQYQLSIAYETAPEKLDSLRPDVSGELARIAREGADEADLAKVKEYIAKSFPEWCRDNWMWLNVLRGYYLQDYDGLTGYMDIVEGFTPDDFKRLASRILADGNMLEVIMEPEPAPQAE